MLPDVTSFTARKSFWASSLGLFLMVSLFLCPSSSLAQVAVTTYHNDNARTGQNLNETVLTPANVNVNSFGKLFSYRLPDDSFVYAQPLILPNVNLPGQGKRNVLFIATSHDVLYAFDADGIDESPLWSADLAASVGGIPVPAGDVLGVGLAPELGISSTPVIDIQSGTIYVVAFTKEEGRYVQRLHALDVATGQEKFKGPVEIDASVPGSGDGGNVVTFNPATQNQRPALLMSQGQIYLGWGSFDDNPVYHGWVISYDAHTLKQTAVFNSTPDGDSGSTWILGSLTADQSGQVYTVTGNGTVSTPDGGQDFGESFIKLTSGLKVADFFTPFNFDSLNADDIDVGSGGPLLVPDQPDSSRHLMIGTGKEGRIYLMDRDNLGQFQPDGDQIVQEIPNAFSGCVFNECMFGTPGYWKQNVYFLPSGNSLQSYRLSHGLLSTTPASQASTAFEGHGATPSISANGGSNGIVWAVRVDDSTATADSALLYAYDASDVSRELYNTSQNSDRDDLGQGQNFIVPTIANGKVYVAARNQVSVYGLVATPIAQDFSLSVAPQTISLQSGSAAGSTLSVSGSGGFNARVTFSASSLPAGTTVSFAPISVTGGGTASMLVSTLSSAPAGTFAITVTASSGTLSHSTSITLIVTAPAVVGSPDFSISAAPPTATVHSGQSASYSIGVQGQNAFSGTVTLACLGLPTGTGCHFTPNQLTPGTSGATGTLQITTGGVTAALLPPATRQLALILSGSFVVFGLILLSTPSRRKASTTFTLALVFGLGVILTSCGGGGASNNAVGVPPSSSTAPPSTVTPAGTYPITISATSGSIQHSTTVQLVVQ